MLLSYSISTFSVGIILTSDDQLRAIQDPDAIIDISTSRTPRKMSLRQICELGQKNGDKTLTIAFDEFFRQYREQAGTERLLTPDMDEYIGYIKHISDFAKNYGMGIGLSLLSPLELGPAFKNQTKESGRWLHYKVGFRDPETGKFSIKLWQQRYWTNNKGKIELKLLNVKAYAFKEQKIGHGPFKVVLPDEIVEISSDYEQFPTVNLKPEGEEWEIETVPNADELFYETNLIRVFNDDEGDFKSYDRVLVILEYETPEMDYFCDKALPFLKNLLQKYKDNDVNLVALYSDELHLQQDWFYFNHHDNGQFSVRFHTQSLANNFEKIYEQDLSEKNMLYFAYGAPTFENGALASRNSQYVMGEDYEDIQKTFLLRDRYYKMINNHVVDLFKEAKAFGEELFGTEFPTHGHSSWAESPTIDLWDTEKLHQDANQYEYTSNFVWSNTVQQAAAGCYDYFKWGEYLQPTGNDFAECGWNDRNYYGAAMATSIGVINKFPRAYAAYWGMPEEVKWRKEAINSAFGGTRDKAMELLSGERHRKVDVLILYPMNLVAVEERFGSWMTQYGYANFITSEKLLEIGEISEQGEIIVKDEKYTTLVALFEPLPVKGLLQLMNDFSSKGGKLLWFGPPALIDGSGENCESEWSNLFKAKYNPSPYMGEIAAGKIISFEENFKKVPEQYILTDFVVDRAYPVKALANAKEVASMDGKSIGIYSKNDLGEVAYFGFRPRDDQSQSLGYESRTLFEILNAIGAYPATGSFDVNDNTEFVSRTTEYFTTRFDNSSTAIVKHYRTHPENWPDGFSRDTAVDNKLIRINPLPSDIIELSDFKVNGYNINYSGRLITAFRLNDLNELIAFTGKNCSSIEIDGNEYVFSSNVLKSFCFSPLVTSPENKNQWMIRAEGIGSFQIPVSREMKASKNISIKNNLGKKIKYNMSSDYLEIDFNKNSNGSWLTLEY